MSQVQFARWRGKENDELFSAPAPAGLFVAIIFAEAELALLLPANNLLEPKKSMALLFFFLCREVEKHLSFYFAILHFVDFLA